MNKFEYIESYDEIIKSKKLKNQEIAKEFSRLAFEKGRRRRSLKQKMNNEIIHRQRNFGY